MNTKPTTQPRNSFWLLFLLLITCCFIIEQASAKSPSNSAPKRGITLDDLLAIKDIQTMTLSPDGNYIAFQTKQGNKDTNEYTLEWYVAATKPNATPGKLAEENGAELTISLNGRRNGQFVPKRIIWSPDSKWIYFITKRDGESQIWRSHRDKYGPQQLTRNAADVQSFKISPDGSKIIFTIDRTRDEIKHLIKKEKEKGFLHKASASYTIEYDMALTPCTDGKSRLSVMKSNAYSCRITNWVYDVNSGQERKATEDEVNGFADREEKMGDATSMRQGLRLGEIKKMEKMSPDRQSLAWIENIDPNIYKGLVPPMILKVSMKGKKIHCPAKECVGQRRVGFKGIWWLPNSKEIIFHVRDGKLRTLSSFYSWTPGDDHVRTIVRNDDRFTDCDINKNRLICGRESWTSPMKISAIDLNNGKISTIFDVNPEFKNFKFTKIEKIFGEDNDGHGMFAHLVYPKNYKKGQQYPLVITNYTSSGFLRGATGNEQPIHVYAQNGIAVLSFDIRSGSQEYFMKISDPLIRNLKNHKNILIKQNPIKVIEHMVDTLVKNGIIDHTRIGISGLSTGASITDITLLRRNYAAASTAYSVTASRTFLSPLSSTSKALNIIYGGSPLSPKRVEMQRKYSIDSNAEKIDTPYLIQVADREYYYTVLNYNALLEAGKPVEMYIYPDEYHVKWQPTHKYMVYSRNLDWFNFWLRDVEDPAPCKAEQYIRWHKLRDMHQANLAKLNKD